MSRAVCAASAITLGFNFLVLLIQPHRLLAAPGFRLQQPDVIVNRWYTVRQCDGPERPLEV